MSAIATLQASTREDHESVDAAFSAYRLNDKQSYTRFLQAHARALPAAELMLANETGLPAWRPRTALLHADLASIGGSVPTPLPLPLRPDSAYAWGVLYVIEGSRLGGRLLAGRVPDGWAATYLQAIHASGEWKATRDAIAAQAAFRGGEWLEQAVLGAKACFELYRQAAAEAPN